jgi:hypothetical protein
MRPSFGRLFRKAVGQIAIVLASIAVGLAIFEIGLRLDPNRMGRLLIWAQADFYPYLGVANLFPLNPDDVLRREYGYHKGFVLYQHRRSEHIEFSGERFQRLFRLADGQTPNPSAFRIFVIGSSVAHAGNVPLAETYFSKLQQSLQEMPYPIQVVAAAKGGLSSTEELVLFTLAVLPSRPDMVVILNGADFVLNSIFGMRPGDPFNASMMYSKHYDLFYNVMRWVAESSRVAQVLYQRMMKGDLAANREFLLTNDEYRAAAVDSLVSIYLYNVRTMIEICNAMGIPVVLAPQPSPDLLLKRHRDQIRSAAPARFERIEKRIESLPTSSFRNPTAVAASYEKMLAAIGKSPQLATHFVDIQDSVDLDHFVDFIHMDAAGQAMLANALFGPISRRLPTSWSPADRTAQNAAWP